MEAPGALEGTVFTRPIRWTMVAAALAAAVILACDDGPSAEPEDAPTPAMVAAGSTLTPVPTPTPTCQLRPLCPLPRLNLPQSRRPYLQS